MLAWNMYMWVYMIYSIYDFDALFILSLLLLLWLFLLLLMCMRAKTWMKMRLYKYLLLFPGWRGRSISHEADMERDRCCFQYINSHFHTVITCSDCISEIIYRNSSAKNETFAIVYLLFSHPCIPSTYFLFWGTQNENFFLTVLFYVGHFQRILLFHFALFPGGKWSYFFRRFGI